MYTVAAYFTLWINCIKAYFLRKSFILYILSAFHNLTELWKACMNVYNGVFISVICYDQFGEAICYNSTSTSYLVQLHLAFHKFVHTIYLALSNTSAPYFTTNVDSQEIVCVDAPLNAIRTIHQTRLCQWVSAVSSLPFR